MGAVLFRNIQYLTPDFTVERGFVGVRGKDIVYTGAVEPADAAQYARQIEGGGKLLLPGLVNAHTHLAMTLLRGYGENMSLQDWLFKRIFPFEAKLSSEAIYWATQLALAESLRFGITSSTDMYMDVNAIGPAADDAGCKLNADLMAPVGGDEQSEKPFAGAAAALKRWHGHDGGRILVDSYIHAEYTTSEERCLLMADIAKTHNLHMNLHLSETRLEHEECKQRHNGQTPAAYFARLGVFDQPTTVAHAVWVEPEDIQILADKGVSVAHNPVSNLKLASGIAPVPAMLKAGVNVTLGTDGVASNNNLNLYEEMKLMAVLHKWGSQDPTVITPAEVLAAATINGAKSQGRDNTGSIEVGKRADLQMLNIDQPHMQPCYDLLCNLVYAAQGSDVELTMVDGQILYHAGEFATIDYQRVVREVEQQRQNILRQL